MDVTISYRIPVAGEEPAMAATVLAAFDSHVAPDTLEVGVEEFRAYAHAESIRARREAASPPHYQVVAVMRGSENEEIVGVAEVRAFAHLSMLFVHPDRHRLGIGRALFDRILAAVKAANPAQPCVTVYSSVFAVPIYERFGFEVLGEARETRGIVHVPMALELLPD